MSSVNRFRYDGVAGSAEREHVVACLHASD
jgi:hypothetical protein